MTEDIKLRLTLDAAQAQQELAKTRQSAEKLGGGLESLQKTFGSLKERTEKQAAAIAILSHAMGQSDSAIGKMVSGVGTLAAAFGAGGPLGVALAVAVPAFEALNKAYDEAAQNARVYGQALGAIDPALRAITNSAIEPQRKAIQALRQELENYGKDARQMVIDNALLTLRGIESGLENRQRNRYGLMQRSLDSPEAGAAFRLNDQRIAELTTSRDEAQANLDAITRMTLELEARDAAANRSKPTGATGRVSAADAEAKRRQEEARQWIAGQEMAAAFEQRDAEAFAEAQKAKEAVAKETNARILQDAKEAHEEQVRLMREEVAVRAQLSSEVAQTTVQLASALGALGADLALSHEDAMERFAASTASAIGGFISLQGAKLVTEGMAALFSPIPNPAGAVAIAEGAVLVAAGAAVQTGGASVAQALFGGGASVGGGGGAARDPGISSGRSGGHSSDYGGRGTTINITYGGASGPTADQGADAVIGALKRAGRRGITPVEVR